MEKKEIVNRENNKVEKGYECMKVLEQGNKIYSVEYIRDQEGVPLYVVKIVTDKGEDVVCTKNPELTMSIMKHIKEEDKKEVMNEDTIKQMKNDKIGDDVFPIGKRVKLVNKESSNNFVFDIGKISN